MASPSFSESKKRISEIAIGPPSPEIIDLTASPEKPIVHLDNELRFALMTASQDDLCNAVLELCEQSSEACKILSSLFLAPPPPPLRNEIKPIKALEEKASRKRKRKICENCGLDPDDSDGCCKYMVMQRAKIQETKDFLRCALDERGEGPNACENCGGDPDEDDGCCKWSMRQGADISEARRFLAMCDSTPDESESD